MKDNNINSLREEINEIDLTMSKLFMVRMEVVAKIASYKGENSLPIIDEDREKEIIKKNLELIQNKRLKKYYLSFLKTVLDLSKEYQKELLEAK